MRCAEDVAPYNYVSQALIIRNSGSKPPPYKFAAKISKRHQQFIMQKGRINSVLCLFIILQIIHLCAREALPGAAFEVSEGY